RAQPALVVAINSGSTRRPASVLLSAFETLASCDLVVGPARDGGYYLVGATGSCPGLFASTDMGTTNARDALLMRARKLGLSVGSTVPFYDIDVADDLNRLADELHLAPARAPRTAAWLAEWRQASAVRRSSAGNA